MTTLTYFSNFSVCDFFHFLLLNNSQKYQLIIFLLIMLFINYQGLSRPLLGATIAPNLVSSVLKKKKKNSLEMVKKDTYLGSASQQYTLFFKKTCPKKHTHASMFRLGPVYRMTWVFP